MSDRAKLCWAITYMYSIVSTYPILDQYQRITCIIHLDYSFRLFHPCFIVSFAFRYQLWITSTEQYPHTCEDTCIWTYEWNTKTLMTKPIQQRKSCPTISSFLFLEDTRNHLNIKTYEQMNPRRFLPNAIITCSFGTYPWPNQYKTNTCH